MRILGATPLVGVATWGGNCSRWIELEAIDVDVCLHCTVLSTDDVSPVPMPVGISQDQHVSVCCHTLAYLPDSWPIHVRPVTVVKEHDRLACNRVWWHRDPKVQLLPPSVDAELVALGGVEVECGKRLGRLSVSRYGLSQRHAGFRIHCCRRDVSIARGVSRILPCRGIE